MSYPLETHVTVDHHEGCAIWIIAIVMIWIAIMLRGYIRQQEQPAPKQPIIEQQEPANEPGPA